MLLLSPFQSIPTEMMDCLITLNKGGVFMVPLKSPHTVKGRKAALYPVVCVPDAESGTVYILSYQIDGTKSLTNH